MPIFLQGLKLRNYRGIGPIEQSMSPFKEFNFFIGANNTGKSTVLNFIYNYLPIKLKERYSASHSAPTEIDALEQYSYGQSGPISMAIGVATHDAKRIFGNTYNMQPGMSGLSKETDLLFANIEEHSHVWLGSKLPYGEVFTFGDKQILERLKINIPRDVWFRLLQAIFPGRSGGDVELWMMQILERLATSLPINLPKVRLIPAYRQIGPKGEGLSDFSGRGLIDRLAEVQNPRHNRREEIELFHKINRFLQTVTDTFDAKIEIPHDREHILVHMGSRILPLPSLGTGIHEVIMIAAFCTFSSDEIVCIEEPEIHLHPLLQRKLMKYLKEQTSNQYFIATHSASFIDTPGAAIFHVTHDGEQTCIRESILRRDRYRICVELGHRASDIVQSNSVVWVEGPSERIYLNHWISTLDPHLIEGIHYSIMFYGGRLLNHLSASDEEVTAFIGLRALNQNLAIVMDSDRSTEEAPINATKKRVIDEFKDSPGVAWVTKGREIENYVAYNLIQKALSEIHSDMYNSPDKSGQYDHSFYFKSKHKTRKKNGSMTYIYEKADKIKLARKICQSAADLDILDLRDRIGDIVGMIQRAND